MVPGYGLDQSAHRSKITGLYAMVLVVEMIKEVWGFTKGDILLGCDGKDALNQSINIKQTMTVCQQQQFDLLSCIQGYLRASPIICLPFHIKGHQDNKKELEDSTRLKLLDVEVDSYAKEFWVEKYDQTTDVQKQYFKYKTPMGMWKVSVLGTRVVTNLLGCLREIIAGGKEAEY